MNRSPFFPGFALVLVVASAAPVPVVGQTPTLQQIQVQDLRGLKDKFISLGEAFPAETYDWTPMEGVRTVKDVLVLIAWEGYSYPTRWGWPAPAGFTNDREVELPRLEALSKPQLLAELDRTFDHIIAVIEGMDEAERARTTNFFGQALPVSAAIHFGMSDMHEHLGQLIAYARTNHIVPPWSN